MSAFYDLASVVLVPSGYKSGKIYAQKPLTTDGQLTFTRASTATRVNASGLIESVASGVPRLDYLGSTCPKLLLEPQRTNSHEYSEQLQNTWTPAGVIVNTNTTVSPDGSQNADTITKDSSVGHLFRNTGGAGTGTVQTFSAYYKGTAGQTVAMNFLQGGGGLDAFKLITFTGQWQRESITFTRGSSYNIYYLADWRQGGSATSFQAWGCQLEDGAYPTSYIPTTSAAVTRLADAASKTGISSLIGQTEGTLFADVNLELISDSAGILGITGSGTTFVYLFKTTGNGIAGNVYIAGQIEAAMSYTMPSAGRYKVALAYKQNDFVLYVNGVQRASDNSGSVPTCTDLYINTSTFGVSPNSKHAQALLFKTRLTNAQLAELTTL
jgi:hypothetical protein